MILSDKSSGSTVLQNELAKSKQINIVKYTRHYENETLYWNKAVAVLGLQQEELKYSELPMNKKKAENDLLFFFKKNLPHWRIFVLNKETLFEGWEKLCEEFGPIFLEKSPHHLHYWSALELIIELMSKSNIDFYFIGLIRNPMDATFSSWKRWNADPEKNQFEWLRAYKNLLKFKKIVGGKLKTITYEKLISDRSIIRDICEFIGIEADEKIGNGFHSNSIQKWRAERFYGFQLSNDVKSLANLFGYKDYDLNNKASKWWPVHRPISSNYNKIKRLIRGKWRKQ